MGNHVSLTVTAKGQVTLRRSVLRHLGIGPGDTVLVDLTPQRSATLRAAPSGRLEDFFGCLPKPARPVSIAEMNEVITQAWAADDPHHR